MTTTIRLNNLKVSSGNTIGEGDLRQIGLHMYVYLKDIGRNNLKELVVANTLGAPITGDLKLIVGEER